MNKHSYVYWVCTVSWGVFLSCLFPEKGFSLTLKLPDGLSWLTSKVQLLLFSPQLWVYSCALAHPAFSLCWKSELRSTCFCVKPFPQSPVENL